MGYKYQLKKQEREKLLREKQKDKLLVIDTPLFTNGDGKIGITYTCQLQKRYIRTVQKGMDGILMAENARVIFWNTVKLGTMCADDTPELLACLATVECSPQTCLASVVTKPNEFGTCQLVVL
jgi:hypothetical protein